MTRRLEARQEHVRSFGRAVALLAPAALVLAVLATLFLALVTLAQAAPASAQAEPAPATAVSPASAPSAPASSATGDDSSGKGPPTSLLYFVFLGDIWRYESESGQAEIAVPAESKALGHPSWSLDGATLAWEERSIADGRQGPRVVFRGPATLPGGLPTTWTVEGGSSPAVSPEGRYVLYQVLEGDSCSLHVLDSAGQPVLSLHDACNGSWVPSATGDGSRIAFDRDHGVFPSNSGFSLYDLDTGQESILPILDAWGPQAGSGASDYLVSKFTDAGDRVDIVRVEAGSSTPLLEVTNNEAFDYRWSLGPDGKDLSFVELVPMGGGRSDIYQLLDPAGRSGPVARLTGSSFGWNASLPSGSPFSDFDLDDLYYQAAALLWADQVIDGFADGTFRSTAPVKRAQFAKMLDGALGVPVYEGLPLASFVDLGQRLSPLYPHEFVSAARHYALVNGYPGGQFRPWDEISRMQAVTMIVRATGVYLPSGLAAIPNGWAGATSGFTHPDHGSNVHLAERNGLLAGIDLTGWDLTAPATRGEVAQLLLNLLSLRGPLFSADFLPGASGRPAGTSIGIVPGAAHGLPIGNIVFDGDSLTAGSTATDPYPSQLMRRFRPGVNWVNLGIGGQRLEDMLYKAPIEVDPLFDSRLGRNIIVVWGGTNDMRHWDHTAEAVYSRLKQYCIARRAKGYTVVVLTMIPRSDGDCAPSLESKRQTLNRKIRATWPGFADALVDVGADRLIGWEGDEVDGRFFSGDRVHLNNRGLSVVAGRVGRLLQQIDATGGVPAR